MSTPIYKSTHEIRPIRTKTDYKKTMNRIEDLISKAPKKGSRDYDEIDVLGSLVAEYEERHYPIASPDPVEAVKYAMAEFDLKPKDLVPYFGSKGNVSEFLNNKRPLSLRTIKMLHENLKLPLEILIG